MIKSTITTLALLAFFPLYSNAADPRNESECLTALADALEMECRKLYPGSDQTSTREQCLNAVVPQVKQVCAQFFGEDADFCATCNQSCTDSFPAGSESRKECLTMCLNHQRC